MNKIEKITNKKVELYRPPYGEYNDIVIKTAKIMDIIQFNGT